MDLKETHTSRCSINATVEGSVRPQRTLLLISGRETVVNLLKSKVTAPWTLKQARSSGEAIALLDSSSINGVILDLSEGGVDEELNNSLAHHKPMRPPLIILATDGQESRALEALDLGAEGVIQDPSDSQEVNSTLQTAFEIGRIKAHATSKPTILLVDDDVALLKSLHRNLRKLPYEIQSAPSGQEALQIMQRQCVDLLITDIRMPKMDGLELVNRCTEICPSVITIVITGHGDYDTAVKAIKQGCFGYLRKPIDLDDLKLFIDRGLDKLALTNDLRIRNNELFNREKLMRQITGELKSYKNYIDNVVNSMMSALFVASPEGIVRTVNLATCQLLGYTETQLIGQNVDLFLPLDTRTNTSWMRQIIEAGSIQNRECSLKAHNGAFIPVLLSGAVMHKEDEEIDNIVGVAQDISERRKAEESLLEAQEMLNFLAYHDHLTSLPNRRMFYKEAEKAIEEAASDSSSVSLMYIDLDRFKIINDSLGHGVGDEILQEVARRLSHAAESTCHKDERTLVARLGGDEFVVMLYKSAGSAQLSRLAEKIYEEIRRVFSVQEHRIYLEISVGIAWFPEHGKQVSELMRCADIAMYRAKSEEIGIQLYSPSLSSFSEQRIRMEDQLRNAIQTDELVLHYQPIVRLPNESIAGFEALVRWPHPDGGLIPPGQFLPIAEDLNLIIDLDQWVMKTAAKQMHLWRQKNWNGWISVNLSARSFNSSTLDQYLSQILTEYEIPPKNLVLEITEGDTMRHRGFTINLLRRLKKLNLTLAIDDFGTGYSSLSYIKDFPVDCIKVDRCFINGIGNHLKDENLIRIIIQLCSNLNLAIVAEGVETSDQLEWLKNQDCTFAQGFFLSRPQPAEEITLILD